MLPASHTGEHGYEPERGAVSVIGGQAGLRIRQEPFPMRQQSCWQTRKVAVESGAKRYGRASNQADGENQVTRRLPPSARQRYCYTQMA